jgi:hypothetical protein
VRALARVRVAVKSEVAVEGAGAGESEVTSADEMAVEVAGAGVTWAWAESRAVLPAWACFRSGAVLMRTPPGFLCSISPHLPTKPDIS